MDNKPIEYGASFQSFANMAANTPQTIVAPASNVRGLIVWEAGFVDVQSGTGLASLQARPSAPSTVGDGDVILIADHHAQATANGHAGKLKRPVKIPAGKGLYYIQNGTVSQSFRYVLYTLL